MRRRTAAWVLALAGGCGGDSGDGQAGSPATPECKAFVSTWCHRAVGCLVSVGTLSESEQAENLDVCVDVAIAAARCERAVAVGPSYDQCLAEVEVKPCSDWDIPESELSTVKLPDSCSGIILLP